MPFKAVAFDWGHTVMDERRDGDIPLGARPIHLMPGVSEVLPQITLPLALWANTRVATETDVRGWLERADRTPGRQHEYRDTATVLPNLRVDSSIRRGTSSA